MKGNALTPTIAKTAVYCPWSSLRLTRAISVPRPSARRLTALQSCLCTMAPRRLAIHPLVSVVCCLRSCSQIYTRKMCQHSISTVLILWWLHQWSHDLHGENWIRSSQNRTLNRFEWCQGWRMRPEPRWYRWCTAFLTDRCYTREALIGQVISNDKYLGNLGCISGLISPAWAAAMNLLVSG